MAALTATFPPSREEKQAQRDALVARGRALGLRGQNELCRRAGVNPTLFSREVNGNAKSPGVWKRLERYLERRERRRRERSDGA